MQKIVITGPTGAIGMALIEKCIQEKIEVLAICHKGSKRVANIPTHPLINILEADLSDLKEISISKHYDVLYHFAWEGTFGESRNCMELQINNIQYTLDAVDLAKRLGCHTFIGAGSQAEYGRVEGFLKPDLPVKPENGYGMAKLCAGQMSRVTCRQANIRHIWTRILSVYGPYDGENSMVMSALRKMMNREPTQFTKGEQIWDYLNSADAANAMYLLGLSGKDGKVYCIGSGTARPLKEYIRIMGQITESTEPLGIGEIPYGDNQVMCLQADIGELMKDTGFRATIDFTEGILSLKNELQR